MSQPPICGACQAFDFFFTTENQRHIYKIPSSKEIDCDHDGSVELLIENVMPLKDENISVDEESEVGNKSFRQRLHCARSNTKSTKRRRKLFSPKLKTNSSQHRSNTKQKEDEKLYLESREEHEEVRSNSNEFQSKREENTDVSEEPVDVLERMFPTSTPNERYRFISRRTVKRAAEKMNFFMEWREKFKLDDEIFTSQKALILDDEESWNFVVSYISKQMSPVFELQHKLPRIIRFADVYNNELRTCNGKRVAYILAAMLDVNLATQVFYSACVTAYLDFKLDRNSLETIAVVIDVRPGTGWPNPPAMSLIPFIKATAKHLSMSMPERLEVCIVYPLPTFAKAVWIIIKGFLDPKSVVKIRLLWGSAGAMIDSPAPVEKMKHFFDRKMIDCIEATRQSEFKLEEEKHKV